MNIDTHFEPVKLKRLKEIRDEAVKNILERRQESGSITPQQVALALKHLKDRIFERLEEPVRGVFPIRCAASEVQVSAVARALRSDEILRFRRMEKMDEANPSLETRFEKSLATEGDDLATGGGEKWANQIPIWSGVAGPRADTKANIDIGYSPESGVFLLYELKIRSDNPLYAIIELVTYALGYLIVRRLADLLLARGNSIREWSSGLLDAKRISWSVLAPEDYYEQPCRGGRLPKIELETVRDTAQRFLSETTNASDFSFVNLQMDLRLHQLACKMPDKKLNSAEDREKWLVDTRASMRTLRKLVRNAKTVST